jgi:hypothetical protein
MKRLCLLLIILFVAPVCWAQDTLKSNFNKYFPVNQLNTDFVFFKTALQKAHPSLYRYQPKDSIDLYFKKAETKLDHPMNELEYWEVLQSVLGKIGSGHTNLSFSKETNKQFNAAPRPVLPFTVYTENNRLYINNVAPKDTLLKSGSEILVINNQRGTAILKQMQDLMTGDGYSTSFKDHKIEYNFNSCYNLLHGDQSQFLITYNYKGVIKTKLFKAALIKMVNRSVNGLPHVQYPEDIPSTAILRIPNFEYKGYFELHEKLFKDIRQHNIKNLVIDIRNNPGGKASVASDLMQYFMKKDFRFGLAEETYVDVNNFRHLADKTDKGNVELVELEKIKPKLYQHINNNEIRWLRVGGFTGNIYLLIDEGTYSAAALFATAVKSQSNCVVIGEETGGGAMGCDGGVFANITLPATRLQLSLPLLWIYAIDKERNYGRGVTPDIAITTEDKEKYFSQGLNPTIEVLKATIIAADKKAQ